MTFPAYSRYGIAAGCCGVLAGLSYSIGKRATAGITTVAVVAAAVNAASAMSSYFRRKWYWKWWHMVTNAAVVCGWVFWWTPLMASRATLSALVAALAWPAIHVLVAFAPDRQDAAVADVANTHAVSRLPDVPRLQDPHSVGSMDSSNTLGHPGGTMSGPGLVEVSDSSSSYLPSDEGGGVAGGRTIRIVPPLSANGSGSAS